MFLLSVVGDRKWQSYKAPHFCKRLCVNVTRIPYWFPLCFHQNDYLYHMIPVVLHHKYKSVKQWALNWQHNYHWELLFTGIDFRKINYAVLPLVKSSTCDHRFLDNKFYTTHERIVFLPVMSFCFNLQRNFIHWQIWHIKFVKILLKRSLFFFP